MKKSLLTNEDLWPVIWKELNEEESYPVVDATLNIGTERARLSYKLKHPDKKTPVQRAVNMKPGLKKRIWSALEKELKFPKDLIHIEIQFLQNHRIPFIRYTVQPTKKTKE